MKILPYGALTWQVKVVTDKFSLKPRANGRNVVRQQLPTLKEWKMVNFKLCETKCENELISMSRAWNKEKIWVPDGIWTYDLPNSGEGGALSTWATENSWRARPYTRFIFDTRSTYCKDQQGRCRTVRWRCADPRSCTVCDVINFSAQRQLYHLTFVGERNLSNHTKASSRPLFANLKILDVSVSTLSK